MIGPGTRLLLGLGLATAALSAWLAGTHLKERKWFERPDIARHRAFDPLLALLRWMLLLGGLLLLWPGSPRLAALIVVLLAIFWSWRRAVRSVALTRWLLGRRLAALRAAEPGVPERDLLQRVVLATHPEWGEELVAQMVIDYRTPAAVARVMARMERGFRGFR